VTLPNGALAGRCILIIEDEPLIALQMHAAFSAAGASITSAANTKEALRTISLPDLSAAVVDITLGDEDCSAACNRLSERGIPFVFYTGEAQPEIMRKWPNAPVLTKLASTERVVETVAAILR
jgi:DNA-binding response OmpR family regulator